MSLTLATRIARRELRGGLRGFRVFLACLALGVAAIAGVGSVRQSIEEGLSREGAVLLGGDAEIELTYRFASDAERAWMDGTADQVSELADFRSMAVFRGGETVERGLTQVKAVDDAYPLYGTVELSPAMPLEQAFAGENDLPGGVMDALLIDRLGMQVGDVFSLGAQDFVLMAALTAEPDASMGMFALGPRTLVHLDGLANAQLLQPGTLFETAYRLRLPDGSDLDAVKAQAEDALDEGNRWRDARNGAPGVARFVERLAAFLVLVGLAGLAVGGVGVSAAVRAYLETKTGVIATLKTLGAERRVIFLTYFLQIGILAVLGIILGLILGALMPLAAGPLIEGRLPVPAQIGIYPAALAEAAAYGLLSAAIFTLWPLARAEDIRAAALFRDAALGLRGWPRPRYLVLTALFLAALAGLAVVLTGTRTLALSTAGGILAAFAVLVLAGRGIARLARWLAHRRWMQGRPALRLAFGAVGGPSGQTLSVVLSLGLGLSVLAAVGQIDANLRGAIVRELPDRAPSFFVVDIQNDQMPGFSARLADDPAVSQVESAPMLRGFITRINDRPADEVAGPHWVLRGDRGVTYSAAQPENATLTQGTWWPADYNGAPQISFAATEGAEMGLQLGDMLTVNILGRDITAEITSFREVDFSGAGMGFILSMNPGALAGAPHTHIATIYADDAAEGTLMRDLTNMFPNITMISVSDAIARAADLLAGIAAATTLGALATLVTGAVVLIGAAAAGEGARTYEAAILKTLGASRRTILTSFALRQILMGLAAGAVATLAGGAAGWAVSIYVMETAFTFDPVSALWIISGGIALTLITGLSFTARSLGAKPARILRARE